MRAVSEVIKFQSSLVAPAKSITVSELKLHKPYLKFCIFILG